MSDNTWEIFINGTPITKGLNRFLEKIEYSGKSGGMADDARLTINDKLKVLLPPKGAPIEIKVNGRLRFKGFTDTPECIISRGGGRTIEVACSAMKTTGKVKENQRHHKDDATLKDFLGVAAKKAGLSGIKVDDELGAIHRPYWNTRGRNFLHLGQSLADELGATFKVRGDQAVFAKRGDGKAPGGGATPTVTGRVGDNVVEARMRPFEGRPRYAKARTRYYDRRQAKHFTKDIEIGDVLGGSGVIDALGQHNPDEKSAETAGKGRKTESEREGGSGSVTILLDVNVEAEGTFVLAGHRPGADGTYRIESWREWIDRSGGGETSVELKQPQGKAGTDSRKAKSK